MNKILVLIPAYNEEQNIRRVIKELEDDFPNSDVLVINDCSSDNTLQVLKEIGGVNYISTSYNSGYASALQLGFKYAVSAGYEYVIQFDGDGQHIASQAKKLYESIENSDSDIVIGSRFLEVTDYKHSFFRKIGTKLFSFLIRIITGTKISDPTSGFQILNKKTFTYYSKKGNFPEYPDANLIIAMLLNGYKVSEVAVKMREREFGVSMHSGIYKPMKYMVNMTYSIFVILFIRFMRIFQLRK